MMAKTAKHLSTYVVRLHNPANEPNPYGVAVVDASSEASVREAVASELAGWSIERITRA